MVNLLGVTNDFFSIDKIINYFIVLFK